MVEKKKAQNGSAEAAPRRRGRPKLQANEQSAGTVQTLEKGLLLLQSLGKDGSATLTNIALQVGMPPSTALRLLTTMQKRGFVDYDESAQDWSVGVEAYSVGCAYLNRSSLIEVAQEIMRGLMKDTGETTNLAIADNGDIVFVAQVETQHPIRAYHSPGSRGHMHASGIGKALLADQSVREVEKILEKKGLPEFTEKTLTSPDNLFSNLEKIRTNGWSLDDEERYLGMRCVAACIYGPNRTAIAGVSISGPTVRFPDNKLSVYGEKVAAAAAEITRLVGGTVL